MTGYMRKTENRDLGIGVYPPIHHWLSFYRKLKKNKNEWPKRDIYIFCCCCCNEHDILLFTQTIKIRVRIFFYFNGFYYKEYYFNWTMLLNSGEKNKFNFNQKMYTMPRLKKIINVPLDHIQHSAKNNLVLLVIFSMGDQDNRNENFYCIHRTCKNKTFQFRIIQTFNKFSILKLINKIICLKCVYS